MKILTKVSFLAFVGFQVLSTTTLASPLFKAVRSKDYTCVESLLRMEHKLVDAVDSEGATALHYASMKQDWGIAMLLIMAGADPDKEAFEEQVSSREIAKEMNNKKLLEIFNQKEELRKCGRIGDTPLHFAIFHHNFKDAGILLERKADIRAQNDAGRTPRQMIKKIAYRHPSLRHRNTAMNFLSSRNEW